MSRGKGRELSVAMTEAEQTLLRTVAGRDRARLTLRTDTRVDTGGWLRKSRAWLCVFEGQLVVLALGRRRYVQGVPLAECAESAYCHATGALVIAPTEELEMNRLNMSPAEAVTVLREIKGVISHA